MSGKKASIRAIYCLASATQRPVHNLPSEHYIAANCVDNRERNFHSQDCYSVSLKRKDCGRTAIRTASVGQQEVCRECPVSLTQRQARKCCLSKLYSNDSYCTMNTNLISRLYC